MEAINDWLDYKLTTCAHKLDKKYKIEKRLNRLNDKIDEENTDLVWKIAYGAAGIWICAITLLVLWFLL